MDKDSDPKIEELQAEIEKLKKENRSLLRALESRHFGSEAGQEPKGYGSIIYDILRFMDVARLVRAVHDGGQALKTLLRATRKIVNSEGVSVLLFSDTDNCLYFEEAVGEKADELMKFRVNVEQSIAGYCYTTGEALAISDASKDPRFFKTVAKSLGQEHHALMAAPLIYRHEVIGVMEAVNKRDGGDFSGRDLELFTQIASFCGYIVKKANSQSELYALFLLILRNVADGKKIYDISREDFSRITREVEKDKHVEEYDDAVELAVLIREISEMGADESSLARNLLHSLYRYMKNKDSYNGGLSAEWMVD